MRKDYRMALYILYIITFYYFIFFQDICNKNTWSWNLSDSALCDYRI